MNDLEVLQYLATSDKIDLSHARLLVEMERRKEILKQHPYRVWQGKNGKWYTYIDARCRKNLKKRNTRQEIEDIIVANWKDNQTAETIDDVFAEWNEWKLETGKISPSTFTRNEEYYRKHYWEFGEKRLKDITPDEYIDFLEGEIAKKKLTAKQFASLKSITRQFLKRAKRRKIIDWNVEYMITELEVSDREFRKTVKKPEEEVFSETETKAMMDYLLANQDEKNLALLLMFVTGMRVGEVVTLTPQDIQPQSIYVHRTETFYRRDGRYVYDVKEMPKTEAGIRNVVLPRSYEWLTQRVKLLNPFGEWVFTHKGQRLKACQVATRLKAICLKLHIVRKSSHKIRKTYVSMLLDSNVDERMVIDQVGHTNIATSERYYHRNRKTIERKQDLLDKIEEFRGKTEVILETAKVR